MVVKLNLEDSSVSATVDKSGAKPITAFTYLAFISYSRKDEAFAAWLQKQLEAYRLPTATLKETPGLPKRVRPVFRDKTDLASGSLGDSLNDAVGQSNKLILICSPHAAQSPWVNKEVEAFIKAGRYEHIIPVIVGGMPFSPDAQQECFPEALRANAGRELLGIDLPSYGKQGTFIRVVASLLGIRYDSLHRRHVKAKRRRAFSVAAVCLAVVLAVAGIAWQIQAQARIPAFASHLSAQAIVLANKDPETAAYFALAADSLNASDESREAMAVVAQNNRYTVASATVSTSAIKQVASNGAAVLALGQDASATVLKLPELATMGTLPLESATASVIWSEQGEQFVALDAGKLKLFSSKDGQVPLQTQSIALGLDAGSILYGPYADSAGGILVLTEHMQGAYWSPRTKEVFTFDLLQDEQTRSAYGNTSICAASGFCEQLMDASLAVGAEYRPINGAPGDTFCFATSGGYVLKLHLNKKPLAAQVAGDGAANAADTANAVNTSEPIVWVERVLRNTHGSSIQALGWLGADLLVGTDAGLGRWEGIAGTSGTPIGNTSAGEAANSETISATTVLARESAFPFGGVAEAVTAIAIYHGSSDTSPIAVLTTSGVRLVGSNSTLELNGVTAASSATSPVTSITTTPEGTWLVGRSNGAVMHLDPGAKPLATGSMDTEASAQSIATDGSLLVTMGLQQKAWGVSRYAMQADETSGGYALKRESDYKIPDSMAGSGIFINAVTGNGEVVAACGKRQPLAGQGIVLVWHKPGSEPLLLEFASDFEYAKEDGFSMVASVAYAERLQRVAAYNAQQAAVCIWSATTGELLHTIELGANLSGVFPEGANQQSTSANGEWLAVSVQATTTVIQVETGVTVASFAAPINAYGVISPAGDRLALVDLHQVSIVSLQGQEQGVLMSTPADSLTTVAWAPDGKTLAVAEANSRDILFFDSTTFKQIGLSWTSPSGFAPTQIQWAPNGTQLMVSNGNWNGSFYDAKGVDIIEPFANTWTKQLYALASSGVSNEVWQENGGQDIAQPMLESR